MYLTKKKVDRFGLVEKRAFFDADPRGTVDDKVLENIAKIMGDAYEIEAYIGKLYLMLRQNDLIGARALEVPKCVQVTKKRSPRGSKSKASSSSTKPTPTNSSSKPETNLSAESAEGEQYGE